MVIHDDWETSTTSAILLLRCRSRQWKQYFKILVLLFYFLPFQVIEG